MTKRKWPMLVLFLGASALASALGGFITASSVDTWHAGLNKPTWNPPNTVFAPVWTILYIFMAIAAWRIWLRRDIPGTRTVLTVYFVHLVLNMAWSFLFFGLHSTIAGLGDIVVLWAFIVWLQIQFWRRDRVAGSLWIPYLLWVTFATALNFTIWRMN